MYMLLTRWYCAVLLLYAPVHIKPSDLRLYNAADVDTVVFCGDSPARQAVEAALLFSQLFHLFLPDLRAGVSVGMVDNLLTVLVGKFFSVYHEIRF